MYLPLNSTYLLPQLPNKTEYSRNLDKKKKMNFIKLPQEVI